MNATVLFDLFHVFICSFISVKRKTKRLLLLHFLFTHPYGQSWTLEIGILNLCNINLLFAGLSETCAKAGIISIVLEWKDEVVKYYKNSFILSTIIGIVRGCLYEKRGRRVINRR